MNGTEPAIERVAAACPLSKFKDDRHEWHYIMHEDRGMLSSYRDAHHALKRCRECRLTVLFIEVSGGSYDSAPTKEDSIIYAYYPNSAPRST